MTDLNKEYSEVLKDIDQHNNMGKWKRFYPIYQQNKSDKYTTVGLHDYKTKKYFLSDLRSHDAGTCISDMKAYLRAETDRLDLELREAHRQEKKLYDAAQKQRSSGTSGPQESFEEWRSRVRNDEIMSIIRSKKTA